MGNTAYDDAYVVRVFANILRSCLLMKIKTQQMIVLLGLFVMAVCVSQSHSAGATGGQQPRRNAPPPIGPNDPRRFLAVTKWYGTYSIRVSEKGEHSVHREDPGGETSGDFDALVYSFAETNVTVELDTKTGGHDTPVWKGARLRAML